MGILSLSYRRPAYVTPAAADADREHALESDETSLRNHSACLPGGVPEALSFDRILSGATCPPLTCRDFMNYLFYVERSAENLQWYLWKVDYEKRFRSLTPADLALSPEWTPAMEEEATARIQKEMAEKLRPDREPGSEIFKGTDFEKKPVTVTINPFSTPPPTAAHTLTDSVASPIKSVASTAKVADGQKWSLMSSDAVTEATNTNTYRSQAGEAFTSAGAKAPFTIQPFREEIDRIIATYIKDGGPRQLNLSDKDRKVLLHALSYTTHPSAFRGLTAVIDHSLRRQHHPNFVRWSICNGNPARVTFARGLGLFLISASLAVAVILTLSGAARGWRAMAAIGWLLGAATLTAAYKGMCVVLHGLHHHHIRPWELFLDGEEEDGDKSKLSLDSFGSSNSFEHEPWVIKYERRNVIRKIFDREVWIREPALRQIQDTIFVQSLLTGLVFAAVCTAIFVPLPVGGYF